MLNFEITDPDRGGGGEFVEGLCRGVCRGTGIVVSVCKEGGGELYGFCRGGF